MNPATHFIDTVKHTCAKYTMLSQDMTLLVGISGGPDSVALLEVLSSLREDYPLNLYGVYVNHLTRGEQNVREARFVRSHCTALGIKCFVRRIRPISESERKKRSYEEILRQKRFEVLRNVAQAVHADAVALGHHKNDLAETVLFRLIRGSGPEGLKGFKPVSTVNHLRVIRPLYHVSRDEILNYLRRKGLKWIEDPTNKDTVIVRNKIRHKLIPYLSRNFNPSIVNGLARTGELLAQPSFTITQWENALIHTLAARRAPGMYAIDLNVTGELPLTILQRCLRTLLRRVSSEHHTPTFDQTRQIIRFIAEAPPGGVLKTIPGAILIRDYKELILLSSTLPRNARKETVYKTIREKISKTILRDKGMPVLALRSEKTIIIHEPSIISTKRTVTMPGVGYLTFQIIDATSFEPCLSDTSDVTFNLFLDADSIHFPMIVRNRKPGDRFRPLHSKRHTTLKKYLIDTHIPIYLRDGIILLTDNERVLWIMGIERSGDALATRSSRRVVRVTFTRK